jgi:cytochrome c oxidase cbb3-type subunit 3
MTRKFPPFILLSTLLLLPGCEREERKFEVPPHTGEPADGTLQTHLQAGSSAPVPADQKSYYEENSYSLSEGKRLFATFNCTGCHAHGGGGIGPALIDDKWIYGSRADQIYLTIVEGRPNGMPSFRSRIPRYQVWQLAAYVRSLAGLIPNGPAPGRDDDLKHKDPENSLPQQKPRDVSIPKD